MACNPGATDEDGLLGLTVLRHGHFFARDFIDYLWVRAERRREGIGATLLRASVGAAKSTRVFTSTNESNRPMQELLAAQGWALSGRLEGLDEGDPEIGVPPRPRTPMTSSSSRFTPMVARPDRPRPAWENGTTHHRSGRDVDSHAGPTL